MIGVLASCLIVLPGPVSVPFAPHGPYAGHWGVDVAVPAGGEVPAPLDGVVTFAGSVAGVWSVTIRAGEYRVSLSYLEAVTVAAGGGVRRGEPVGVAGTPHGRPGVHVGVRWRAGYVDPQVLACSGRGTLRLLPPPILRPPGLEDRP